MTEIHVIVCDSCGRRQEVPGYNADGVDPGDFLSVGLLYPANDSPLTPLVGSYCSVGCLFDKAAQLVALGTLEQA